MMITRIFRRAWDASQSIRWRLPLSYAAIALLTASVLGGLLLITLDDYYTRQEREYLTTSSLALIRQIENMYRDELSVEQMNTIVEGLSFLAQARIQLLDVDRQVVIDSGPAESDTRISVGFAQWQEEGITLGKAAAARPYVSFGIEPSTESLPENASEGDESHYPLRIRRGPFGQLISESASPTQRSTEELTVPILGASGVTLGYLVLSEGPAFGNEIVNDVAEKGIVAAVFAILSAVAAGVVISRSISRPVLVLSEATTRMAHGDLAVHVSLQRRDEFGLLAGAFNTMSRRIESTINMLRQFVADAAHEINTPLTALRTNLELTISHDVPEQAHTDIQQALAELTRLEMLTRNLLVLARLEDPSSVKTPQAIDVSALARQMAERYASRAEQATIEMKSTIPHDPVIVMGDRERLARVFDNLLDNALKFTPAHGHIHLTVQRVQDGVRLALCDTGIGIPLEDREHLFSRFHRGRNAAAFPGNGLGLVIVKAIVADHGGQIDVESGSAGTCFTITLPMDGEAHNLS